MDSVVSFMQLAVTSIASFGLFWQRSTLLNLLISPVDILQGLVGSEFATGRPAHHRPTATYESDVQVKSVVSIIRGDSSQIPSECIHHAFDLHAAGHPLQMAVVDHSGEAFTYGQMRALSLRLSDILTAHGVCRGSRVCLLVQRSVHHIIAIFSILRLGAAYIPLDGAIIPHNAILDVLQDSQPKLIMASREYMGRLKDIDFACVCLEDMLSDAQLLLDDPTNLAISESVSSSESAYVIYTSGTTGRPKGVSVSHLNVTNLVLLRPGNLGIVPGVRVAQLLNVAFDMCAWEIFACLLNGGTLHLRGPRRADWIKAMQTVDVVICTPSILVPHDPADYPNIKVVATAGEPCPQALADRWSRTAAFYNCCGPTETTIVNTMHLHTSGMPLSIGEPTPNNHVYVLDDQLRPVARGEPGIMWAGGLGVSQGYLNRPELTSTKFRPDPFHGGIMYNTGDLGRWRFDGKLDHLGRIDEQVKVKGFRVELDGVSAAMRCTPGVVSACALLIGAELWGFYSPEHIKQEEVQNSVMQRLPCYAVPVKFIGMHELQLTGNGKVDKHHLRCLAESRT
ncbi:AMP-binding protein [Obba rivulosa]|uniref:AMP-binding protein n=1 Tax=Obba rivulosa TaxID=1052685 RepID=A0A8E2ASD5_9APHY|nr:AMP-binding protein [Obba rivulosa]